MAGKSSCKSRLETRAAFHSAAFVYVLFPGAVRYSVHFRQPGKPTPLLAVRSADLFLHRTGISCSQAKRADPFRSDSQGKQKYDFVSQCANPLRPFSKRTSLSMSGMTKAVWFCQTHPLMVSSTGHSPRCSIRLMGTRYKAPASCCWQGYAANKRLNRNQ